MTLKEHYALSKAQLQYLSGQNTLKFPAQEKTRIRRKAEQSFEVGLPIVRSKVVGQEFKDLCYPADKFDKFFEHLVKFDDKILPSEQNNKQIISQLMVKYGLLYFQQRYKTNELVNDEISKINNIMDLLYEQSKEDNQKNEALKMYQTRKKLLSPPVIQPDEFYHALCIHCYSYSLNVSENENQAIKNIVHDPYCTYHKKLKGLSEQKYIDQVNRQFIHIIKPKRKERKSS